MGRNTTLIPKAPLGRLMMEAGAQRVSDDACETLCEHLEERAEVISKKAKEIALHSGRKTINAGDVKIAAK